MRPIVVGDRVGKSGYATPLDTRTSSGRVLASLCEEFPSGFDRINSRGHDISEVLRGRRIIVLGREAERALGLPRESSWGRWRTTEDFIYSVIPHPSGRNRWYNDARNRRRVSDVLRRSLRPTIYVEGPDGAGKTTLIRHLSTVLGVDVSESKNRPRTREACLSEMRKRAIPGSLNDRSSGGISELVYGEVLRGKTLVTQEEVVRILSADREMTLIIYCRPPTKTILESHAPRENEDPEHVRSVRVKHGELIADYDAMMLDLSDTFRVVEYDWTARASLVPLTYALRGIGSL